MTQHAPHILAEDIHFAYQGQSEALCGVNFSAAPGECVAIVGANGSGKTTLMKVFLRLLSPRQGRVSLGGRNIMDLSARDLYRTVGMVFQNPGDQLFGPTVEEDVAFGPRNLGQDRQQVRHRVEEALDTAEAKHLRDRPIHHLSFGEQKRVCLAGVLAMQPKVLLMDEPTAGLDPSCERHMVELLTRVNRDCGITVILATHAVDLLPLLATRLYVLNEGRPLADGPMEDLFGDSDLICRAGLRLPFISQLFDLLRTKDGLPFPQLPLTVGQARQVLMERFADAMRAAGGNGR